MKNFLLALILSSIPLLADDAKPLSNNFFSVGAVYNSHVNGFAEYGRLIKDGVYSVTGVQSIGIYDRQLQTSVTESICYLHNLGEYLTVGGCGKGGPSMDHSAMGMSEGADLSVEYKFGSSQHWGIKAKGSFLHSSIGSNQTPISLGVVFHWN